MSQTITDLELFDRAVYQYLYEISDRVVYAPTNIAIQTITKNREYEDVVPLGFFSFYREPNIEIDMDRYNFTATTLGDMTRLREDTESKKREAMYVANVPVNLTYQVDVWASKATNVQQMAITLITKIYMREQVILANMNPKGEEGRFHLIDVEWVDNSDLESENDKGRLYRHTIKFTVDARIKLTKYVGTTEFCCIPVDIYDNSNEGD